MVGGRLWRLGLVAVLLIAAVPRVPAAAAPPGNAYFERIWARTDRPVADGQVNRTWMWGPEGFTGVVQEPFRESPGGARQVQYFDKSRMEISDVGEDPSSIWYVTNGLLVVEMMTGRLQTGLNSWEQRQPAQVNVAGDANDPLGATYQYFGYLTDLAPLPVGTVIHQIVSPGSATNLFMYNERFNVYGVTTATYVPETNHTVASVFWDFMTSSGIVVQGGGTVHAPLFENPFYATGLPVTEAYWATVKVGGVDTDVLIQCFERRCLTYTPSNSAGWQVEAGNVGQHYYAWRHGQVELPSAPTPPPTLVEPLPDMIWTYDYLNPEAVVNSIFKAHGHTTSMNNWLYRHYYENAYTLPGLYSISTVGTGYFNHDTTGFYEWVNALFVSGRGVPHAPLCAQVLSAMNQPNTEIARRLREFEIVFEQERIGFGAYAYGIFLLEPTFGPFGSNSPYATEAFRSSFDMVARDFAGAKLDNPQLTFAQYSTDRGFHQRWCGS